jgi:hypothetical protein
MNGGVVATPTLSSPADLIFEIVGLSGALLADVPEVDAELLVEESDELPHAAIPRAQTPTTRIETDRGEKCLSMDADLSGSCGLYTSDNLYIVVLGVSSGMLRLCEGAFDRMDRAM